MTGNIDILEYLLQQSVNLEVADEKAKTPVRLTVDYGHIDNEYSYNTYFLQTI
jgi:hypothetical protein